MNPHSHYSGVFHASLHQADIALKELLTILGFAYCTATQQCHGTHRLFGVSSGPTQRLLSQPSPGPVVSGGLASYLQRAHLPAPLIPPEQLQRSGRSVQRSDHFDRMVHQQPRFSGTSRTCGLHAPDRPLCDGSQQTLRSVRFSLSRSPSSGDRRIQPLLGQLGSSVSVSTDSVDFEGFGEAETNSFRQRSLRVPRAGGQALVSQSALPGSQIVQAVLPPSTARAGLLCSPTGSDASDRILLSGNTSPTCSRMTL